MVIKHGPGESVCIDDLLEEVMVPELEIQKYLRAGGTLDNLKVQYGISSKRHPQYNELILLKYSQIESDFSKQIVCECRGIILNENDNWNIVSQAYKKFFNLGESLAAEIDWSTAKCFEKVDGCFRRSQSVCLWEGKTITFGELFKIYNEKGSECCPKLLGVAKDGTLVPSSIIAVKNNGTKNNWLRLHFNKNTHTGQDNLVITDNHSIFSNGNYIPASLLKQNDEVETFIKSPNKITEQFIKACLLGDGSISPVNNGARFSIGHKIEHLQYDLAIEEALGDFAIKNRNIISGYGTKMTQVNSCSTEALLKLRKEWYPKGIKIIPKDLSWMDDLAIAIWYMDDGSLSHHYKQEDRADFATNGFTEKDVKRLAFILHTKYNVDCNVYNSKGWCIRINAGRNKSIDNFWKAISPFIIECMRYKLPKEYRCEKNTFIFPKGGYEFISKKIKIKKIEKLKNDDKALVNGRTGFDIQTSTENYFAGAVLVHNSLCTIYYYAKEWHVATTGTPDAGGNINLTGQKFSNLFWETFKQYGDAELDDEAIGYCFFFELTSPLNRIVVRHMENSLTLLGGRDPSGHEITPAQAQEVLFRPIPVVKEFPLTSFEEILSTFDHIDPLCQEGYVVCDSNFNRVKVKSPAYVALHHAKDGLSLKAFVQIALMNETSEVLVAFPEFAPMLNDAKARANALIEELEAAYEPIKHLESQKEFALEAKKCRFSGPLFLLRAKKTDSIRTAVSNVHIDRLMDLLGYKDSKEDVKDE